MPAKKNIIAYSGAHGTGKSTAVLAAALRLKREDGIEAGIIREVARQCPYPIVGAGTRTTREAQHWMFVQQMRLEIKLSERYPLVLADRSVVDYIAYASAAGFHDLAYAQLCLARHHVALGIYQQIRFHGMDDFSFLEPDGVRDLSPALQAEVQARMLELYAELGIPVTRCEIWK